MLQSSIFSESVGHSHNQNQVHTVSETYSAQVCRQQNQVTHWVQVSLRGQDQFQGGSLVSIRGIERFHYGSLVKAHVHELKYLHCATC